MMQVYIRLMASLACVCAVLLAAASVRAEAVWSWENPTPQGNQLNDVWAASDEEAFAVGWHGTILHRSADGWQLMETPVTDDLRAIWGFSATDIYAVGANSAVLHYNGRVWSVVPGAPADVDFDGVWGPGNNLIFAVGGLTSGDEEGVIYSWNGASWTLEYEVDTYHFQDIHGAADTVFAVNDGGFIARYKNGVWEDVQVDDVPSLRSVWVSNSGEAFAAGIEATVMHYRNTGSSWEWVKMDVGFYNTMHAIWGFADDDVYLGGIDGAFHYDGEAWARVDLLHATTVYGLGGSSDQSVLAVSTINISDFAGQLWRYDGTAWRNEQQGVTQCFTGIWAAYGAQPVAVGYDILSSHGVVLQRGEGGWREVVVHDLAGYPTTTPYLYGVCGRSASDIYAVGKTVTAPAVFHYDGQSWRAMSTSELIPAPQDVWCAQGTDVYVLSGQTIYSSAEGYWKWQTTEQEHFLDIWGSGPDDIWAVGEDATILHYTGAYWRSLHVPELTGLDVRGVWGSGPDDVYCIGGNKIMHYDGEEWSLAYSASTPLLCGIDGIAENSVWVTGSGSILVHYDGKQWQEQAWPLSAYSIPHFSNPNFGMAGTEGMLWMLNGSNGILAREKVIPGAIPPVGALLLDDN